MTTDRAEQILSDARQVRPSRVVLTVLGAVGTAVGWLTGRAFVAVGWTAGRTWLIGAYFVEAVIYGFRSGAKLPPRMEPPPGPPSR